MGTIRVGATSRPIAVAGAIAGMVREHGETQVLAVGANAVNQAVKSIAIARNYLLGDALAIGCVPQMVEISVDGVTRTAILLHVFVHRSANHDRNQRP